MQFPFFLWGGGGVSSVVWYGSITNYSLTLWKSAEERYREERWSRLLVLQRSRYSCCARPQGRQVPVVCEARGVARAPLSLTFAVLWHSGSFFFFQFLSLSVFYPPPPFPLSFSFTSFCWWGGSGHKYFGSHRNLWACWTGLKPARARVFIFYFPLRSMLYFLLYIFYSVEGIYAPAGRNPYLLFTTRILEK